MVLNQKFRKFAAEKFNGGVESADFNQCKETAKAVNRFVREKTFGKITQVVTLDVFDG